MSRLPPLDPTKFTPEQQALAPQVSRGRDRILGPFSVWIRNPPIADAANRLLAAIRQNGKLDKRLYELLVLTVVRRASVQFAHELQGFHRFDHGHARQHPPRLRQPRRG